MVNESNDYRPDIRQRLEVYHGIDRDRADAIIRDLEPWGLQTHDVDLADIDDVENATGQPETAAAIIASHTNDAIENDRETFVPNVYIKALDMAKCIIAERGRKALDEYIDAICSAHAIRDDLIAQIDHYL